MTDDRRVLVGPPKPRSSFSSPGWTPLLINGALLRHDAPFMFIGCSAVTELFGYTFTDRSEKSAASFCLRYARTTGHRPSLSLSLFLPPPLVTRPTPACPELHAVLESRLYGKGDAREEAREAVQASQVFWSCVRTPSRSAGTWARDAQRGFLTAAHSLSMAPQHCEQILQGWTTVHQV